jgi:hypothetical protein
MFFRRRILRAYALARAALALSGSGAYLALSVLPLAIIAQVPEREQQKAPQSVSVNILVIEGDSKKGDFDPRLEKLKNALPGVKGAKVLDELKTKSEEGSSVSLEIMRQSGDARLLKVMVRKVEPDGSIRLRLVIEALKFSIDTKHENGATIVVRHPLSEDKSLFLAVTPKY